MGYRFKQFFSTDSSKASKAVAFGWLNGINYMAPANSAGAGNLCPHASAACIALCLGEHSGQAAIHVDGGTNSTLESRKAKARLYMSDRAQFMIEAVAGGRRVVRKAIRMGLKPCLRMDGSTGIAMGWLRTPCVRNGVTYPNIFAAFPEAMFIDYTKNPALALVGARGQLPSNYYVTFSFSGENEKHCRDILAAGGNVAVVFGADFPESWYGARVIDGDKHDLRHLDPRGGYIVGLKPKGNKAKKSTNGFVVRNYT